MAVSNAIIRACLLYEFKLGSKAAEACRKICTAFGEGAVAERTSQKWFKKPLLVFVLMELSSIRTT